MGLDLRAKRRVAVAVVLGSMAVSAALAVYQSRKLQKDLQGYKKPEVPEKNSEAIAIKVDPYFCYESGGGHFAKEMASLKTAEGKYFFTCKNLINFHESGGTAEYAKEFFSLRDGRGDNFSFTADDIVAFRGAGGTSEEAREMASLRDGCGNNFFTAAYDIVAFKKATGSVEYAKKFASTACHNQPSFRGNQLPQLYALGLDLTGAVEFTNTSKPNALIVYPTHDGIYNDENYGAYRTTSAVNLFKEIQKAYDVKIIIASTEDEVYQALEGSRKDKLFMLCGHGTKTTLSLGEKDLRIAAAEKDETYRIDPSDSELELKLQNLDPAAVIFLNSCSNAEGGEKEDNLANAIAKWAKGRKTIAATEVLWTHKVTVNTADPFEVTLMDKPGKKNITYVTFGF